MAVVEDQEQVDKLLEIRARCPQLSHIIYDDARGLRHHSDVNGIPLLSPSGVRAEPALFSHRARAMEVEEIAEVVAAFGAATQLVREAGLDGIEINAAQ